MSDDQAAEVEEGTDEEEAPVDRWAWKRRPLNPLVLAAVKEQERRVAQYERRADGVA